MDNYIDEPEQEEYFDPAVKQKILTAQAEIKKAGGFGEIYIQYKGGCVTFVNHTIRNMLSRFGNDYRD